MDLHLECMLNTYISVVRETAHLELADMQKYIPDNTYRELASTRKDDQHYYSLGNVDQTQS